MEEENLPKRRGRPPKPEDLIDDLKPVHEPVDLDRPLEDLLGDYNILKVTLKARLEKMLEEL